MLLTPGVGYCKCKCRCQAVNVKLGQMCPRYQMWKYDLGQVVVSHSPENGLSSWVLQLLRDMRMKREKMKEREKEYGMKVMGMKEEGMKEDGMREDGMKEDGMKEDKMKKVGNEGMMKSLKKTLKKVE